MISMEARVFDLILYPIENYRPAVLWHGSCDLVDAIHTKSGIGWDAMSLFAAFYKLIIWAARSAALVVAVFFLSTLLRFSQKR